LAVTVGLLISQILGVESLLGTDNGWPYLLGVALFPSILQMSLLPFCPESPRYLLITKQREQEAREGNKIIEQPIIIDFEFFSMSSVCVSGRVFGCPSPQTPLSVRRLKG